MNQTEVSINFQIKLNINQQMMLFSEKNHQEKEILSGTASKRQRFRKEIRRSNLMVKFQEIRAKLVQQLESSTLQTTLLSLNEQFDQNQFKQLLSILQGNCDSLQFNENMAKNRLQQILVDVLLKNSNSLSLTQSTQIISALTHLTYYSSNSIESFVNNEPFMDYLRIGLQKLQINKEESLLYFIHVVSLLMNVASQLKFDFNVFLAESDICNIIINQLNNTIRYAKNGSEHYCQLVYQARQSSLRLFFNIVKVVEAKAQVCQQLAKLVGDVLRDEQNLKHHKYRTFFLLGEAMKNDSFWTLFLKDNDISNFCIQICQAIDQVQCRCFQKQFLNNKQNLLTKQEAYNFYAIIFFMNQLDPHPNYEYFEICWIQMVQNVLNGYMLGQFLIEAHQNEEKDDISEALKLFVKLSRTYQVTGEQLIIVRPADDPLQLLKIFTNRELVFGPRTGAYCLEILQNLLRKENKFLPAVMEFRILDLLSEIFNVQASKISINLLQAAIQLCIELVSSQKQLGQKKIMAKVMENKGIIKAIQHLYDHPNRNLYTKAERFNELINQELKKLI